MKSVTKVQCFIGRARARKDCIFAFNINTSRMSTYDYLIMTANYIHDFKERFGRDVPFDIWGGLEKTKQFDETIDRNYMTPCDLSKFAGTRHNKEVIKNYEKHLYSHLDFTKIFDFKTMKELVPGAAILLRNYIYILGDIHNRNSIVAIGNGFSNDSYFSHHELLIECFGGLENFNKFNEYVIDKFVEDLMPDSHKSLFNNDKNTIDYFIIAAFMCNQESNSAFDTTMPNMIEHLSFTSDEYKREFKNRYLEKAINLIYSCVNYKKCNKGLDRIDWIDLVMSIPNINCKKVFSNVPYTTDVLSLFSHQIKKCNLETDNHYLPSHKAAFLVEVLPTFLDRKILDAKDLILIEDKLGNLKRKDIIFDIGNFDKHWATAYTEIYDKVKSEVLQDEIKRQKNLEENVAFDIKCEEAVVETDKKLDNFDFVNVK